MRTSYMKKSISVHKAIMEDKLGREIEDREVIHHIDGNKRNNRTKNLIVMNKREHASLHNAGLKKPKPKGWKPANTLNKNKVKEILSLKDKYNYSQIGRMVGVSGFPVARYIKNNKGNKNE